MNLHEFGLPHRIRSNVHNPPQTVCSCTPHTRIPSIFPKSIQRLFLSFSFVSFNKFIDRKSAAPNDVCVESRDVNGVRRRCRCRCWMARKRIKIWKRAVKLLFFFLLTVFFYQSENTNIQWIYSVEYPPRHSHSRCDSQNPFWVNEKAKKKNYGYSSIAGIIVII